MPPIGTRPRRPADRHFRDAERPGPAHGRAPQSRAALSPEQQDSILCGVCGSTITHRDQAIQVNHSHEHAFFNPAGLAFVVRCFGEVPGVAPIGKASNEFTWFPGHRWQVALCRTCGAHLGWLFIQGVTGSAFHALIVDRLA